MGRFAGGPDGGEKRTGEKDRTIATGVAGGVAVSVSVSVSGGGWPGGGRAMSAGSEREISVGPLGYKIIVASYRVRRIRLCM